MPFVLTPQVWKPPALTAVKVPAGGVAWPLPLRPQQARVPFVLSPQVWKPAGAHRGEGARGRGGLAVVVVAPAGDGAVRPYAAGVGDARRPRSRPPRRPARWRSRRRRPRSAGRRRRPSRRGSGEGGRREGDRATEAKPASGGPATNALHRKPPPGPRPPALRPLHARSSPPTLGLPREPTTGAGGGQRPRKAGWPGHVDRRTDLDSLGPSRSQPGAWPRHYRYRPSRWPCRPSSSRRCGRLRRSAR